MKITEFGIFNLWEEGNQTLSGDLEHFSYHTVNQQRTKLVWIFSLTRYIKNFKDIIHTHSDFQNLYKCSPQIHFIPFNVDV